MKILELRFKNLNSLYGEWCIDFTDPEYISNGIFALTGPTGAGKSTILDAVCLALYGATPRLGKITRSNNEIMSRQTGECYAEVLFKSQAGRFRCHFSQHRARKKISGELQSPRHEIAQGTANGAVIEHQLRRVSAVVEEKTGMDFDRFTRSSLLAQGGFDTFLKADVEQKSKILEQITGTEIYTNISRRVHERWRHEREKLTILQAAISGIALLDPEEEKEIRQELTEKQKQEAVLAAKSAAISKAIAWLNGIEGLQQEISALSAESEKLKAAVEVFRPERERLAYGLKAAEFDGQYATLTALRQQQNGDQTTLAGQEDTLPALVSAAAKTKKLLKRAGLLTRKAAEEQTAAAPLLHKVRLLDQQLQDVEKGIDSEDVQCGNDAELIAAESKGKDREQKRRDTLQNELQRVLEYLETHARDEWLVSGLAGIREQLTTLLSMQREITEKTDAEAGAAAALKAALKKNAACTDHLNSRKKEVKEVGKRLDQGRKELAALLGDRLLREFRSEKETLLREMAYLARIAELEDHRSRLEDGRPCPLCGAEDHPFARGNIPAADETEKKVAGLTGLIHRAEELELRIKELEAAEKDVLKDLHDSEKLFIAAANDTETAGQSLKTLSGALQKDVHRFTDLKHSVLAGLKPLGIETVPDADVPSLLTLLKKRLKQWQDQVQKKGALEKQISALDGELKRLDAVIETRGLALAQKRLALAKEKKKYEKGLAERQELFGAASPDAEENRLQKVVTEAAGAEKGARAASDEARQKVNTARTAIIALRKRIETRHSELQQLESTFSGNLQAAGFADEKKFLQARLTAAQRHDLAARAKQLDDRQTDLLARQKDRENRLAAECARKVTRLERAELEPAFRELEQELSQLRDQVASLKHALLENSAARERIKEKQTLVEAQKKECGRWQRLHDLIGSADGKKYRNFAQGLTFELMVSHANRQLIKMTDRYLLVRDVLQPLELNVIDNYQAGEIRSTRNLSGGESFIVSLALALGLSRMASRKVRVDSLFLDEGFGTLDEEALETALETLAGLQQDGKLIGVISHVSALKERISTRIAIVPVSGGRSRVVGPGCMQVAAESG